MAEALSRMLRDPEAARLMAQEGKKTVSPLKKELLMEKWYEVLAEEAK